MNNGKIKPNSEICLFVSISHELVLKIASGYRQVLLSKSLPQKLFPGREPNYEKIAEDAINSAIKMGINVNTIAECPVKRFKGDRIFFYEKDSCPFIKLAARIDKILWARPWQELWRYTPLADFLTLEAFQNYFRGCKSGVLVFLKEILLLENPKKLSDFKGNIKVSHPYGYLNLSEEILRKIYE